MKAKSKPVYTEDELHIFLDEMIDEGRSGDADVKTLNCVNNIIGRKLAVMKWTAQKDQRAAAKKAKVAKKAA